MQSIVITVMSPDRPGLVKELSDVIVNHGGSWGQSNMANLAGQFAGIMLVAVEDVNLTALQKALVDMESVGIRVFVSDGNAASDAHVGVDKTSPVVAMDITGHDQPGIVQEVASVCTNLGVNLVSLETEVVSGSMSGEPMFVAKAQIQLLDNVSFDTVLQGIEAISDDLIVDY